MTTTNTYNGLNLLTNVLNSGGVMNYAYTATGAKGTESNKNVTTIYQYNERGLLIKQTETSAGLTVVKDYKYDLAGNRSDFTLTKNGTLEITQSYEYDNLNRLVTVEENGQIIAEYDYDENGNLTNLTYSNGVTTSYSYNNANLVTSLTNNSGGSVISGYTYSYYLDGNQATKIENTGKTTSYDYDGLGRLISEAETGVVDAITKTYSYDTSGNRETLTVSGAESYVTAYIYDDNNRLLTEISDYGTYESTNSYTYDHNGNQLGKFETRIGDPEGDLEGLEVYQTGIPEENETYEVEINEYDTFNRLIKAITNSATAEYTYKADGLRYSKTVDDQTTIHVWDGGNIVLEADAVGSTIDTYIRGINLIKSDTNGYYVYNAHGDVVELTDNGGVVTKSYVYDAFGVEKDPQEDDTNPFRYAGEYYDKETGSIYLRNRYYNPLIGRFSSEDPIRDGLNWYTYANGNPIMFVDPFGLAAIGLEEIIGDIYGSSAGYTFDSKTGIATVSLSKANGSTPDASRTSLKFGESIGNAYMQNGTLMVESSYFAKELGLTNRFGSHDSLNFSSQRARRALWFEYAYMQYLKKGEYKLQSGYWYDLDFDGYTVTMKIKEGSASLKIDDLLTGDGGAIAMGWKGNDELLNMASWIKDIYGNHYSPGLPESNKFYAAEIQIHAQTYHIAGFVPPIGKHAKEADMQVNENAVERFIFGTEAMLK